MSNPSETSNKTNISSFFLFAKSEKEKTISEAKHKTTKMSVDDICEIFCFPKKAFVHFAKQTGKELKILRQKYVKDVSFLDTVSMVDQFIGIDHFATKKMKQRAFEFTSTITEEMLLRLFHLFGFQLHKSLKMCFFHEEQTEDEIALCKFIVKNIYQRFEVIKSLC